MQEKMSINVTVHSNPVNIRRGRMVLSDLEQIKKNERDRRRRLRIEQVRQQSKDMSTRLIGRVKNAAKEELSRLAKDSSSALRRQHDNKIMGIQQKLQDDFEDIGQAHVSAALEPDVEEILEKERKEHRTAALKRGKEALHQMKETQERTIMDQQEHQERLRQVRDLENVRSSMISQLPKKVHDTSGEGNVKEDERKTKGASKKDTNETSKKLPGKSKTQKQSGKADSEEESIPRTKQVVAQKPCLIDIASETESEDKMPRTTVPVCTGTPMSSQKTARYNPGDYTQENVESTTSDSSSTISDDSSYFSDTSERRKYIQTPKYVKCPGRSKVRVYDHGTRQRNEYDKPMGVVERIDVRNEPSAMDLAKEIEEREKSEQELANERRSSAQRRGEDAILREKVRRDYQNLVGNLDQLSREERKLNASQAPRHPTDVHLGEQRRRALHQQHKRRLDHTMKTIYNRQCGSASSQRQPETIITLKPREDEKSSHKVPNGVWQDACYCKETDPRDEEIDASLEIEKSREEQLLDMLKKVERQKRLLLQEFGADLPDDIFNASIKSLFDQNKTAPPPATPAQPPLSPEIKVINMSCGEDEVKKTVNKKQKSPVKKVETAVQTMADKSTTGEDKGVQVEVLPERRTVQSNSSDTDIPSSNNYHQPLEPKVKVIRPEANSSESSISTVAEVHIDVGKNKVKVTPTKGKSNIRTTKRAVSKVFHKSHSMAARKFSSPAKRLSKSLPASGQTTPQKTSRSVSGTPTKTIDIYVNRNGLNINVEPSPRPKTAVDASTQSSQAYTMDTQEPIPSKPYRIQSHSRRIIKIKDTSDTSTSYASLPPVRPRTLVQAFNNNTPILEMLDSSANESLEKRRGEISPVSTPETPSPRTMMLPSNMPRPDRISKMLKYGAQRFDTNGSPTFSSTRNNRSSSVDQSNISSEPQSPLQYPATSSKLSLLPMEVCSCKNPLCKLMHTKMDDMHSYALKNCPKLLNKYEELQNTCTERIASLTDHIERVRNEQKDMELSAVSPAEETSYMELPWGQAKINNDLQNVRKLVQNLETINTELTKGLLQDRKTRENEEAAEEENGRVRESRGESSILKDIIGDATVYLEPRIEAQPARGKPKIVSDEKVHVHLKWLNQQPESQDDDMIEKLSKEILEQSAGLSKNSNPTNSFRETNSSSIKPLTQSVKSRVNSKGEALKTEMPDVNRKEENFTREVKKDKDFVPLLAGIAKVSRTGTSASSTSARGKPPITLYSAPFRSDIESPGHELSTIVEFDTPDTANKSQNPRTPSPTKKATDSQVKSVIAKPSVYVAPLSAFQTQHLTAEKSPKSPSTKQLSAVLLSTHRSQEIMCADDLPEKLVVPEKPDSANLQRTDSTNPTPKKSDKKLQCDATSQEANLRSELKQLDPASVQAENGDRPKEDKNKITSSSSNSLSALSGISEITSTPSSDIQKYMSSPEEMETALEKLGLGWAITILKKTRAASALSSSSNSDCTPINTARRMISPPKKQLESNGFNLPDFSDVSVISIKEASKSTEQAVLLKGRTSTPMMQRSNSNSGTTNTSSTNSSDNVQERSDSLIVPNVALTAAKPAGKQLENL